MDTIGLPIKAIARKRAGGASVVQIAKQLKLSREAVRGVIESEEGILARIEHEGKHRSMAKGICMVQAPLAVRKAISIIDGSYDGPGKEQLGPDHVLRAIKLILDRAIPIEPVKVNIDQSQRTQVLSLAGVKTEDLLSLLGHRACETEQGKAAPCPMDEDQRVVEAETIPATPEPAQAQPATPVDELPPEP